MADRPFARVSPLPLTICAILARAAGTIVPLLVLLGLAPSSGPRCSILSHQAHDTIDQRCPIMALKQV